MSSCSIHRRHTHAAWDNSLEPVAKIVSGSEVTLDCLDASNGQITPVTKVDDFKTFDLSTMNPLFGPIYVQDARPGDALQIDILSIETADYGWSAIFPGFGLLANKELKDCQGLLLWHLQDGYATTHLAGKTVTIPTRPFCGEIGVARALPGSHSSSGNIDTKYITQGASLILPVEVDGALLSLGDGHALQGDGEVGGTAIETSVKVKSRITLLPAAPLSAPVRQPQYRCPPTLTIPEVERDGFYTTMGIDDNFLTASQMAVWHMVEYIMGTSQANISKEEAIMLCSAVGDLQALQVVDMPNYSFGFRMPEYVLRQLR